MAGPEARPGGVTSHVTRSHSPSHASAWGSHVVTVGGGVHPADVGAARHGGHAARRRLLRPADPLSWVLLRVSGSPAPDSGVVRPQLGV